MNWRSFWRLARILQRLARYQTSPSTLPGVMADDQAITLTGHTVIPRVHRGGVTSVWLAREEHLNRLVAVKVFGQHLDDSNFKARFERQVQISADLAHPHIVPIHQHGLLEDGRPFMSMPYLDGGSLRDRLSRHGPRPVYEALWTTQQVALALKAAHASKVVHGALNPDNIMFHGGTALLMGFGTAAVMDASTTRPDPETVKYFSPEQALGKPVNWRSDLYALGVLLYEMVTGHRPIEADSTEGYLRSVVFLPPAPLPPPLHKLQGFQSVFDLLLAKDPSHRLNSQSVIDVIDSIWHVWKKYESPDRHIEGVVLTPLVFGEMAASQGGETAP